MYLAAALVAPNNCPFSFLIFVQSNAQRAQGNNWGDKICGGKMTDIGYAPILFAIIIILTVLFINSVLVGNKLWFYNISSNSRRRHATMLIMTDFLLLIKKMTDFLLLVPAPNLTKVTAVVGLWGWGAVTLVAGSLIMFYKCAR